MFDAFQHFAMKGEKYLSCIYLEIESEGNLGELCGEKTIPPSHHKFYEELVSLGVDKVEDGDTLCSEVSDSENEDD